MSGSQPRSEAFGLPVGRAVPSGSVSTADRLIDPARYPSEGEWAFCRFDSERIPAVRLGFQRGGFAEHFDAATWASQVTR